jgi:hypothetical protein
MRTGWVLDVSWPGRTRASSQVRDSVVGRAVAALRMIRAFRLGQYE